MIINILKIFALVVSIHVFLACNKQVSNKPAKYFEFSQNDKGIYEFYIRKGDVYLEFYTNKNIKLYSYIESGSTSFNFFKFNSSGKLISICIYNKDSNKKNCKFYYPNGNLKLEGQYINDLRFGEFSYYDETGNLSKKYSYYNDTINGEAVYFSKSRISKYYLAENDTAFYGVEYKENEILNETDYDQVYFFKVDDKINESAFIFYFINPPHLDIEVFKKDSLNNYNKINYKSNPLTLKYHDVNDVNLELLLIGFKNFDTVFHQTVNIISQVNFEK